MLLTYGQIISRIRYLPQQQRTETLTQRRSNLKPQRAKNTLINCMWYRSRLFTARLLRHFPTFLSHQQATILVTNLETLV